MCGLNTIKWKQNAIDAYVAMRMKGHSSLMPARALGRNEGFLSATEGILRKKAAAGELVLKRKADEPGRNEGLDRKRAVGREMLLKQKADELVEKLLNGDLANTQEMQCAFKRGAGVMSSSDTFAQNYHVPKYPPGYPPAGFADAVASSAVAAAGKQTAGKEEKREATCDHEAYYDFTNDSD